MADLQANRYVPTYEERVAIDFLRSRGFAVIRQRTHDKLRVRIRALEYGKKEPMTKAEKLRKVQEHQRDLRAKLLADPTAAEHGHYQTYVNWGCRCDACKEAWRVYCREYRARKRREAAELNNGQRDREARA